MIQRIQTIYLTLSAILLALMFNYEIATIEGSEGLYDFSILGLFLNTEIASHINYANAPLYIGVIFIIALLTFSVLQYKHRKRQVKFVRLAFILVLSLIVISYFLADHYSTAVESLTAPKFGIGIYLAVACLPLIFLAIRGIKKDEALIKSLDRIR